jgi:hypothetical protein
MTKKQDDGPWYKDPFVWKVALVVFVLLVIIGAQQSDKKVVVKSETVSTPAVTSSRWDGAAVYDQLQTGMTRAEAEKIIGDGPQHCTTSETPGVGTMELCSYGNPAVEKITLSVTYLNGAVYNKTKLDL